MQVREALEEYKFYCLRHSPHTQTWYTGRLNTFAGWCEQHGYQLEEIKAKTIRLYIDELAARPRKLSSYTIHGHARIIRTFFNWLAKEDDFEELVSSKVGSRIPMPKIEKKVMEVFTTEEYKKLVAACEKNIFPMLIARNKAILAVLLDTGIRAGEICGLTLDHVFMTSEDSYIRVLGKGSKEREVGLGKLSQVALKDYIQNSREAPPDERHVFLTHRHEALTTNGLNQALYRLADRAQVEDCHAHKFRHTFAYTYLLQGGDIYRLSRLMGHTSSTVTEVYLRAIRSKDARLGSKSVLDNL